MKIPVIMMFNDNYVIPAAVAIYSMLKNANKRHKYDLRIMHTNITDVHQTKLSQLISEFKNATITFYQTNDIDKRFNIPDNIAGYPREIAYKFILADIFTDIERAIVTDVDVVFVGDISKEFIDFTTDEYFAGVKQAALPHDKPFSSDITDNNIHFMYGAGYMIYNTAAMRRDKMPQKYIDFMHKNTQYLHFPDQEVLNIVSLPKIKVLHPRNMALVTWWRVNDFIFDKYDYNSSWQEHQKALQNPIQIHYVCFTTWKKPWYDIHAPLANLWYRYLTYTNFFEEFYDNKQCTNLKIKKVHFWSKIYKKHRK